MRAPHLRLLAVGLLLVAACARGSETRPAESPPVARAVSAEPDAAAPDPLDEKLRHCPLTVETAKSEVRDVDGGVELTVRVASATQLEELANRVHHMEEFTAKDGHVEGRHNTGKGGGHMQNCPVVSQHTSVRGEKIDLGFRIVVRPNDPSELASLRAETRKRLAALTVP